MGNGWESIEELRKIEEPIAGLRYSISYAQEKNLLPERLKHIQEDKYNKNIHVRELIEIRELEDGSIQWRRLEEKKETKYPKRFDTSVGCFISEYGGEFGGTLQTPFGRIEGNFVDVFEFAGKIYAVDSWGHMVFRHFNLYEITKEGEVKRIYHNIEFMESDEKIENFLFEGKYITEHEVYFLIGGDISYYAKPCNYFEEEFRILRLVDGQITQVISIPMWLDTVENIIVRDNKMYFSQDKMVTELDMGTGEMIYRTFVEEEAEENLIKNKGK